jgi:hypothetical protein
MSKAALTIWTIPGGWTGFGGGVMIVPFGSSSREGGKRGGVEPEGQVVHPATGTPQGGTASPVLANLYGRLFGREGTVSSMTP